MEEQHHPGYVCETCDKRVNGFHHCRKVVEEETKECGCRIVVEEGFEDLFSCFIERFEYLYPCAAHETNAAEPKNKKRRRETLSKVA